MSSLRLESTSHILPAGSQVHPHLAGCFPDPGESAGPVGLAHIASDRSSQQCRLVIPSLLLALPAQKHRQNKVYIDPILLHQVHKVNRQSITLRQITCVLKLVDGFAQRILMPTPR